MKNVIRVFRADQRRLSKNVVAIVMILGLSIIPSLYAWFNILSNWDPYGPSATANMHIAVVSSDAGASLAGYEINAGDKIISALEANDLIGWEFPETEEEALEGVRSGDCYAAILVPTDFSDVLMSFLSGDPECPKLLYYENSKKNAIATKITAKVKNTLKAEIDAAFISTLTDLMTVSGGLLLNEDGPMSNLEDTMLSGLRELDAELTLYLNALDSLSIVTDSAVDTIENASSLLPTLTTVVDSGKDTIEIVRTGMETNGKSVDTMAALLTSSIETVNGNLSIINEQVNALDISIDFSALDGKYTQVTTKIDAIIEVLDCYIDPSLPAYARFKESYEKFRATVESVNESRDNLHEDTAALKKQLSGVITQCQNSLLDVEKYFNKEIVPTLNSTLNNVNTTLDSVSTKLDGISTDCETLDDTMVSYRDTVSTGNQSLEKTVRDLTALKGDVEELISSISGFTVNGDPQRLIDLWADDPETLATFISSPVLVDEEILYEISNYGSAMSPFYTVLALWVGALILSAIFHVKIHEDEETSDIRGWQKYFGRYLTFFLVGQLQSALVITGNLLYVQIQYPHPVLLYLAGAMISFTFTILIYSLTYALGNVGQAAAVIVMVIQVAGAGGTFPIEVLPTAYQAVYRFLPFVYSMNAMRECVGGLSGNDFLRYMGILWIYVAISIVIGLFLGKPFRRLHGLMEKSKEQTGFM